MYNFNVEKDKRKIYLKFFNDFYIVETSKKDNSNYITQ